MRQSRAPFVPRYLRVLFACSLLALTPACGNDDGSADAGGVDAPAAPDTSGGPDGGGVPEASPPATPFCTTKTAAAGVADLSGTWAARIAGAQIVNALGGLMRSQVILHFLVTISQQGSTVVADGKYCDRAQISLDANPLIKVSIPDAWAHSETPVHRIGTYSVGSEGFPVLEFSPITEAFGAALASPADPLPTSTSDPRVIDQDGDGKPGITVVVTGVTSGTIFAVQSQTTSIRAIAVAPDRLEGALTFTSAQNVLGSEPSTLAVLYSLGSSGADPVVCNSSFAMVKLPQSPDLEGGSVDGGSSPGCEWVRANEATLFP
jgi:hypothetical protein